MVIVNHKNTIIIIIIIINYTRFINFDLIIMVLYWWIHLLQQIKTIKNKNYWTIKIDK